MNLRTLAWIAVFPAAIAPLVTNGSASEALSWTTADRTPSRILHVGPNERLKRPSYAAAMIRTGDTVRIAPGTYYDCVVWPRGAQSVTVEGAGEDTVITGQSCEYKALFVV